MVGWRVTWIYLEKQEGMFSRDTESIERERERERERESRERERRERERRERERAERDEREREGERERRRGNCRRKGNQGEKLRCRGKRRKADSWPCPKAGLEETNFQRGKGRIQDSQLHSFLDLLSNEVQQGGCGLKYKKNEVFQYLRGYHREGEGGQSIFQSTRKQEATDGN
ncbi:RNA-binding protein 25, partial [Ophiophagus hannah]